LFRSRNLSGANIIQASMLAGMFGFFFLGSLDVQRVLHYGPLAIGLAFLPNALAMGALSVGLSARLIMRYGSRSVLLAGQALVAISLVLLVFGPATTQYLRDWFVPMVLLGIGAGLAFPALTILAMADATPSDAGLASGILNTTTQVGAALGLAVLATLSTNRTSQLVGAGQSAVSALSSGYHFAWAIGAGLVIASIVLTATMLRSQRLSQPHDSIEVEEASA
jgi:MFS family permease